MTVAKLLIAFLSLLSQTSAVSSARIVAARCRAARAAEPRP